MLKGKKYLKSDGTMKFLICLGFSIGALVFLSLIMTIIAGFTKNPGAITGIFALVSVIISAVAGGIFTAKMKSDEGLLYPMLVALSLVLTMLLIAVIVCGGRVSGGAFMNYGCYLGVYVLSAFLGKHKPARRYHKR